MTTRYVVWVRRKIEVNTDLQRRCYWGCHAKSEMVWTAWEDVLGHPTREAAEDTLACFQKINPTRQYKITEEEVEASHV